MVNCEISQDDFRKYLLPNAKLKKLATGFDWTEGPVWFGDANCLLFSDIPGNQVLRWNAEVGISVFRSPSNFANGHTRDRRGRLIACEHGSRRVTRTEYDGSITVIADNYLGKRLNSPNDVVVKSDDSIWFTDPHYGIVSNYEGHLSEQELGCNVYRVDPLNSELSLVTDELDCPNGLVFDREEKTLFVSDTGTMYDTQSDQAIFSFDVTDGRRLTGKHRYYKIDCGVSDGMRLDTDGNIWTSAGDGVHCIMPEGVLAGKIKVPEVVSNICFGGRGKHVMFITATTSVYSLALNCRGFQSP